MAGHGSRGRLLSPSDRRVQGPESPSASRVEALVVTVMSRLHVWLAFLFVDWSLLIHPYGIHKIEGVV